MGLDKSAINPATGKSWATNPATGQWDDNYFANSVEKQYNATNGGGNSGGGNMAQSAIDTATKLRDFNIQSNQPAIQQYEKSKTPLQDRYKAVLDSIKGNQQVAETRQTTTTNNEMGRRGISNDSGVYQQEMTNALNPITQGYSNQSQGALAQQNIDMSNIDQAIAQLRSGNPETSVNAAIGIAGQEEQSRQFAQQIAQQQAQQQQAYAIQQAQQALLEKQYNQVTLPQSQYELNKPYYKPSSGGVDGGMPELSGLEDILNNTPSTFKPIQTSTSQKVGQSSYRNLS